MAALTHRRLRAPSADGAALIDPTPTKIPELIRKNLDLGSEFDRRAGFRIGFRVAAREWLSVLSGSQIKTTAAPIILSGHQPELFHPGVWFKNFLLSSIAQSAAGVGINLIIDNDAVRSPAIRVPTSRTAQAEVVAIPFDAPAEELPWEERSILDEQLFRNFSAAIRQSFAPFMSSREYSGGTILDRLWPFAIESASWHPYPARKSSPDNRGSYDRPIEPGKLGHCLAGARHSLEQELGLTTTEHPLSGVASGENFLEFASHLFARHQEFHAAYNAALAEYRSTNRIRSKTHPVPELARDGEWYEMPLWLWTAENNRRRAVFVRQRGNSWEITDRMGIKVRARANDMPEMTRFSDLLQGRGIKLRPRALITTMYARLVLSDLFIHGIGGAKYDELTDLIIRRFFGIEPPAYVTATATFRLPIERPTVSLEDVQQSAQRIREVRYRPESFLNELTVKKNGDIEAKLSALAAEKRTYLDQHDLRRCSAVVFKHLDSLNRAMHELLQPVEQELRARHAELIALARQSQLLGSREFSFVLFPAEKLSAQLLALSKTIS
ncbi:MAG TPA: hypothetical protein VGI40_01135 [Pirellulaceae bacterium]|jgi:hypothetical protein